MSAIFREEDKETEDTVREKWEETQKELERNGEYMWSKYIMFTYKVIKRVTFRKHSAGMCFITEAFKTLP